MSRFCLFTGWTLLLLALMHIIQVAVVFLDSSAIDSFRLSVALIELIVGFAVLWLQNMMRYWGSKNKNMH